IAHYADHLAQIAPTAHDPLAQRVFGAEDAARQRLVDDRDVRCVLREIGRAEIAALQYRRAERAEVSGIDLRPCGAEGGAVVGAICALLQLHRWRQSCEARRGHTGDRLHSREQIGILPVQSRPVRALLVAAARRERDREYALAREATVDIVEAQYGANQ